MNQAEAEAGVIVAIASVRSQLRESFGKAVRASWEECTPVDAQLVASALVLQAHLCACATEGVLWANLGQFGGDDERFAFGYDTMLESLAYASPADLRTVVNDIFGLTQRDDLGALVDYTWPLIVPGPRRIS